MAEPGGIQTLKSELWAIVLLSLLNDEDLSEWYITLFVVNLPHFPLS